MCAREICRVELRPNENVSRFHLAGSHTVDADDVIAERTLEHRAQLAWRKRPHPSFELGDVLSTPRPAKITASFLRAGIHGLALREEREVATALDLGEYRLGFRA